MKKQEMNEKLLDEYTTLIDHRLEVFFDEVLEEAKDYHPFVYDVYLNIKEFVLRKGKRLASTSTLLTYKGYTNDLDDKILNVGVGIELYRHSILAHDDLVDTDAMRRGGKAFHKIFDYDRRFVEGVAIFAGNIMYALSIRALQNSGFQEDLTADILKLFADDFQSVNESQILDILFEFRIPDAEEWEIMASKRAASLFNCTILAGAILAKAPRQDLIKLKEASSHIGYCFDIQDDIIGTFAAEEDYGREPKWDIIMGKKPLHTVFALEKADEEDVEKLKKKGDLDLSEIEEIKEIIRKTKGLERAKEISREHALNAINIIKKTKLSKETREFFVEFIKFVSESLGWYK